MKKAPYEQSNQLIVQGVLAFISEAKLTVPASGTFWNLYALMDRMCHDPKFRNMVNNMLDKSGKAVPLYCYCRLSRRYDKLSVGTIIWVDGGIFSHDGGSIEGAIVEAGVHTKRRCIVPVSYLDLDSISATPNSQE